jgi:RimJ/RimL family protein N-acetyltransferase
MQAPFLIGTRVYLRAVEPRDAPLLTAWMNDPEVTRFVLSGAQPLNEVKEASFIERMYTSTTDVVLLVCLREPVGEFGADTPLGVLGLHGIDPVHRFATLGIALGVAGLRDRGLGTEATALLVAHAFESLNLERVELSVFDHNPRAHAVYTKLGFVEEGRLVKRRYKGGAWRDEILMAISRTRWLGARTAPVEPGRVPRPA